MTAYNTDTIKTYIENHGGAWEFDTKRNMLKGIINTENGGMKIEVQNDLAIIHKPNKTVKSYMGTTSQLIAAMNKVLDFSKPLYSTAN